MKLYFSRGACSLASHIIVKELDLAATLIKVDLAGKKFGNDENYWQVNKKGYVPALQLDNGALLTEGVAILQYLADLKPDANLAPANGTWERYKLQEWLTFINSEIHKLYTPLFDKSTPEQTRSLCLEKLDKRYAFVAEQLTGKPFLLGDQFTVADAYLFITLLWANAFNISLAKWPALKAYQESVASRPSVLAAQAAEKAA